MHPEYLTTKIHPNTSNINNSNQRLLWDEIFPVSRIPGFRDFNPEQSQIWNPGYPGISDFSMNDKRGFPIFVVEIYHVVNLTWSY